jgi:hypothetical protein
MAAAEASRLVRSSGQIDTVVKSVVFLSAPAVLVGRVESDWDRSSSLSSPVLCGEDTPAPGLSGLDGHHPPGGRRAVQPRRQFILGSHYEVWGQRDR